jgi:RNA recognition motif-containing protein
MSRRGPIHTVFVGNLAYEVTEEQLHEAFQRVGPVLAVRCAIPPLLLRNRSRPRSAATATRL